MSDNERVLRFPASEKVFHNINTVTWFILIITGGLVYFHLVDKTSAAGGFLMKIHIITGIVFTFNLLAFIFMSPDRFYLMMNEFFKWNTDDFRWFKNLGGYPRRFGIPFGPEETAPVGKYNAGQKLAYILFIFSIAFEALSGWLLYFYRYAMPKASMHSLFMWHVWLGVVVTLMVVFAHFPLSIINFEDFKAMWRWGNGSMPLKTVKHHNPKWFEKEVEKVEETTQA